MSFKSINPATGELINEFEEWEDDRLEKALATTAAATTKWSARPLAERADLVRRAGGVLLKQRDELARLMAQEMGKVITEARAEVEKCALVCDYYADNGAAFLADEVVETDAGRSFVAYQPLGTVLAIMPWNYPLWQVFRFAAPALVAGNTGILKHSDNCTGCALAIEKVFREAGLPEGVFRTLLIGVPRVEQVIRDRRVHAVTLTGSERAGRAVANEAGDVLKKTVLELGGSDPFVVLPDAPLDDAVAIAVKSRFQNAGQSCIASKRFILVEAIAEEFLARFRKKVAVLKPGDPQDERTVFGPMARRDLRDTLHQQVEDAIQKGAHALIGCKPVSGKGFFYEPSILDGIKPGMRAWEEELFGPVATVIRVKNETDALAVANASPYGLGGSVWTRDKKRGEAFARQLACGGAFVNGLVKSDPRLPFGGIKQSGYGRELSHHGIREFVNAKTIWIA